MRVEDFYDDRSRYLKWKRAVGSPPQASGDMALAPTFLEVTPDSERVRRCLTRE